MNCLKVHDSTNKPISLIPAPEHMTNVNNQTAVITVIDDLANSKKVAVHVMIIHCHCHCGDCSKLSVTVNNCLHNRDLSPNNYQLHYPNPQ